MQEPPQQAEEAKCGAIATYGADVAFVAFGVTQTAALAYSAAPVGYAGYLAATNGSSLLASANTATLSIFPEAISNLLLPAASWFTLFATPVLLYVFLLGWWSTRESETARYIAQLEAKIARLEAKLTGFVSIDGNHSDNTPQNFLDNAKSALTNASNNNEFVLCVTWRQQSLVANIVLTTVLFIISIALTAATMPYWGWIAFGVIALTIFVTAAYMAYKRYQQPPANIRQAERNIAEAEGLLPKTGCFDGPGAKISSKFGAMFKPRIHAGRCQMSIGASQPTDVTQFSTQRQPV